MDDQLPSGSFGCGKRVGSITACLPACCQVKTLLAAYTSSELLSDCFLGRFALGVGAEGLL